MFVVLVSFRGSREVFQDQNLSELYYVSLEVTFLQNQNALNGQKIGMPLNIKELGCGV
jgi:hypothetical protein